jgi:ATP adenylyltransferase
MDHIWAPWRIQYIESPHHTGCILCEKPGEKDDKANCILFRASLNFVMLNGFPYNPGHLLISPFRHVGGMEELTKEERDEHFEVVARAIVGLRKVLSPGGFNIGINTSRIAGAGVDGHFHTHIVPRWQGDTNFMTTVADVRVLPEVLAGSYEKLKGRF